MKKYYSIFILLSLFAFNSFSQTGTIKVVKPKNDSTNILGDWYINQTREVIKAWNEDQIIKTNDVVKINSDGSYTSSNKALKDGKWEIKEGKMTVFVSGNNNFKYVLLIQNQTEKSVTLYMSDKENVIDVEIYFYLTK